MRLVLLAALTGLLSLLTAPADARAPAPLTLRVEVLYEESRVARESWRSDLEEQLVEELERARCVTDVASDDGEADLWLSVNLEEFSVEHGEGGEPYFDDRAGRYRPGRSYLCRISLSFALLAGDREELFHTDRFTVAQREGTSSNPLFEPRDHAYRRAVGQTVRELRRHTCKRIPKIEKLLARRRQATQR